MALIETVIIIPLAGNDARSFTARDWDAFHAQLGHAGNGSTRRGPHIGSWTENGVVYTEPVYEFEVAIESWFDLPAVLDVVRWAQEHFDQLAIMFKVAGIPEVYQP